MGERRRDIHESVRASHGADHGEQVRGIVGSPLARREHQIVTAALALPPSNTSQLPHERMEPEHRCRDACQEEADAVVPRHMRYLVKEHDSEPLPAPLARFHGQEKHGACESPHGGNRDVRTLPEAHRSGHAEPPACRHELSLQIGILDPSRPPHGKCRGGERDKNMEEQHRGYGQRREHHIDR
jgi:hypothetical protein